MMDKKMLRTNFMVRRKALSPAKVESWSLQIKMYFLNSFDFTHVKSLHTFLPIRKKNEVNTWPIIDAMAEKVIVIPHSDFNLLSMQSVLLGNKDELKENKYGIPEVSRVVVYDGPVDVVLVPLLAVDEHGHRVGYGGGFYDRFLSTHPQSIKIGLSLFAPVIKIDGLHKGDVRLDYCITPDELYIF